MRVLITRPKSDGERTAALLRECGHEVIIAPLLQIEALRQDLGGGPYSGLIMTSGNAAHAVTVHPQREMLLKLPVFAIGEHTAGAARSAGFRNVFTGDGDIEYLVHLIASRLAGARDPLLYLAGEDRSGDLDALLAPHGLSVRTVVIYRAAARPELPVEAAAALKSGRLDGVLHYSRRTAEIFLDAARAAQVLEPALKVKHYCLAPGIAKPLIAAGAAEIHIAENLQEKSLIGLLRTA
jgi:uroporphyrinogen-III synthase